MKTIQLKYPFPLISLNAKYIQIGIERPHNIPVVLPDEPFSIPVKINDITYAITDKEILEFGDIYGTSTIEVLEKNNPYLIIDLAYETAG